MLQTSLSATDMKKNSGISGSLDVVFHGVNYSLGDTPILRDVYGAVRPGQTMAIMGATGAGKTTLLNCLSGRLEPQTGEITIGGTRLNKDLRRKICYVLQQDMFFENLTLMETLTFTAMMRLPDTMSTSQKMEKLNKLIHDLDLCKCVDTAMGGMWMPGLSGGERKRASIACELITDPTIILLDEPTSGLDYKTAFSLVRLLKQYAMDHHKIVISTIHQPSTQMFYQFDLLMLMCSGYNVYYGSPREVTQFLTRAGYPMDPHYNPADFMLEKVKESPETQQAIIQTSLDTRKIFPNGEPTLNGLDLEGDPDRHWNMLSRRHSGDVGIADVTKYDLGPDAVHASLATVEASPSGTFTKKWPTGFLTQYRHLTVRAFKLAKARLLDKFKIFETVFLCAFLSITWFRMSRSEANLRDIMGLIYYISMHWGFTPLFDAVVSFPTEKMVIHKERSASWYRLSAYYMAKMTSEMPAIIIQPILFLTIVYLLTIFHNAGSFFATLGVIVLHSIIGQSIGLCIGIVSMDLNKGISLATVIIMVTMLVGGFYTRHLPKWLDWLKYLAFLHYTFHCLLYLEFYNGADLKCVDITNSTQSLFASCNKVSNSTQSPSIPSQEVLKYYGIDQPFWQYLFPLFIFIFVFRLLGYLLLRFYQKPH